MDTLSPAERSERMSRVRSRNTKPEMVVRKLVFGMGYRYRLHSGNLPGHPDLVFAGRRKVIFVHGCFWHHHPGCGRTPKTRRDFWVPKLEANWARDIANQARLENAGWSVAVVWECEIKHQSLLRQRLRDFLEGC
jgi:DNA mismatch endonuclease (patch repair protein)